jgi:(methylthio)acryloyl-CoA hydratase
MTKQLVTYAIEDCTALIGLNRLDKHNAINDDMYAAIINATVRAGQEARVAVIYSHGKHFSSGKDLQQAAGPAPDPGEAGSFWRKRPLRPFTELACAPIPLIAAIRGACVGGGFELAAACHLRVADRTAFFALPEGQRGIFVGGGGSVRITRLIGVGLMTDLMLTGRVLSAVEAKQERAIQYLVDDDQHLSKARELAARIAENTEMTNWAIINGLPRMRDVSQDDGLFFEALLVNAVSGRESRDRIQQFLNKTSRPIVAPESGSEPAPPSGENR